MYYSKYVQVIPLKDKKGITITDESYRKPNKIWVDKGNKFYNQSMKSWLQNEQNDFNIKKTCIMIKLMINLINTTKHIIGH